MQAATCRPPEELQEIEARLQARKEEARRNPGALEDIKDIQVTLQRSDRLVSIKEGEEGLFYLADSSGPRVSQMGS